MAADFVETVAPSRAAYQLWVVRRDAGVASLKRESDDVTHIMGECRRGDWTGVVIVADDQRVGVGADGSCSMRCAGSGFDLGSGAVVSGLAVDIARRTMALPSAPEPRGTGWFLTSVWLAAVRDIVADPSTTPRPPVWNALSRLHPCGRTGPMSTRDLGRRTADLSRRLSWVDLWRLTASGSVDNTSGVRRDTVAWMDPDMFARWMLAGHPPVIELLDDLSLFVSECTHRSLESAAAVSLGIESWPITEGGA